jgi:hypothetical protein
VEDLGSLGDAQAAEETQLDHLSFSGIDTGQGAQRIIKGDDVVAAVAKYRHGLV